LFLDFLVGRENKTRKSPKSFLKGTAGSDFQNNHHRNRVFKAKWPCGLVCGKVAKTHRPVASLFCTQEGQKNEMVYLNLILLLVFTVVFQSVCSSRLATTAPCF
jgi:hypothetical protein